MAWDVSQYLKFAAERQRPAVELLGRVDLEAPRLVHDLGCGAGNVTWLLAERWPEASIVGVDSSPEMLAKARAATPDTRIEWVEADLGDWSPPSPPDLIYSNASLHWLDCHDELFPRLMGVLAEGGILAVQMPRNFGEPSHTCIHDAVEAGPWREALLPLVRVKPVAAPRMYYRWLAPHARRLDIWETVYQQVLEGENPVVEFTKGSILRPILAVLDDAQAKAFLDDYGKRVLEAYPPERDGRTLFPFRRLFIVAKR